MGSRRRAKDTRWNLASLALTICPNCGEPREKSRR
ncbi:50S ribosomal protein L32 [Geotalea uraniireducens]